MPRYLVQLTSPPDAWAALLPDLQNRIEAIRPALEAVDDRFERA